MDELDLLPDKIAAFRAMEAGDVPDNSWTQTLEVADSQIHPFAIPIPFSEASTVAPTFIIDDVISAGWVSIAGSRGSGKTSAILPLMASVTGCCKEYPLSSSIQRQVLWITEDAPQAFRILHALHKNGELNCSLEELHQFFHIVQAQRLPPDEISKLPRHLGRFYTDNERADGSTYGAPPVVVFDTTNATITTKDGNQASEISEAINGIKQRFGDVPCIAIGHVSKAVADKQTRITTKGSGSWEDDAQQVLYLEKTKAGRFLRLDKRRFETDITTYQLESRHATFDAEDVLGVTQRVECVYGWPEPVSGESANESRESKDADVLSNVIEVVRANPGLNKTEVCDGVGGNKSSARDAIRRAIESGSIRTEDGAKGSQLHYYNEATPF